MDTVKLSVQVPVIHTADDEWQCNVLLNRALMELRRGGGCPVTYKSFYDLQPSFQSRIASARKGNSKNFLF